MQGLPTIWDLVRRAVDGGADPGSFLLTGSSSPAGLGTHSGAGRIVTMRMRPLALSERLDAPPSVSLADLLNGDRPRLEGDTSLVLEDHVREILSSGFPGFRGRPGPALALQLEDCKAALGDGGQPPAKTTVLPYRDALQRLWILDPLPGWLPTNNRLRRLGQQPKHHLADPALAAHLLGVSGGSLGRS